MFDINRYGMITMNRGDTWDTQIFVNIGTELLPWPYQLGINDYVYFGVMEPNQPFEHALIRKRIDKDDNIDPATGEPLDAGYYNIKFDVKDTEFLMPGTYYYEVKLLRHNETTDEDKVDTIIPKTKFVIYE